MWKRMEFKNSVRDGTMLQIALLSRPVPHLRVASRAPLKPTTPSRWTTEGGARRICGLLGPRKSAHGFGFVVDIAGSCHGGPVLPVPSCDPQKNNVLLICSYEDAGGPVRAPLRAPTLPPPCQTPMATLTIAFLRGVHERMWPDRGPSKSPQDTRRHRLFCAMYI